MLPQVPADEVTPKILCAIASILADLRPAGDCRTQIDQIAELERLRGAVAGAQAAVMAEFAEAQRAEQLADKVPARRLGCGISQQLGLARKVSPGVAGRHLSAAVAWRDRLPSMGRLLRDGEISEAKALAIATRSAHLDDRDARQLDRELAPDVRGWNLEEADQAAQDVAYRLQPQAFVDRRARAEKDRRVSIRPAPDAMSIVSALLPAVQGVAVFASLTKAAEAAKNAGDERSKGQLMADTLVCRVTGQEQAPLVPVEIVLTMSLDAFLFDVEEPGFLDHIGPIDAATARCIAAGEPPGAGSDDVTMRELRRAKRWVRRLMVDPISGIATDIDRNRRLFDGTVRRFITHRDRTCRMPYCGARIAHIDHVTPYRLGGRTEVDNAQGLDERCNHAKDMPGWAVRKGKRPGEIITRTPTGHEYSSVPPPALGYGSKHQVVRPLR